MEGFKIKKKKKYFALKFLPGYILCFEQSELRFATDAMNLDRYFSKKYFSNSTRSSDRSG